MHEAIINIQNISSMELMEVDNDNLRHINASLKNFKIVAQCTKIKAIVPAGSGKTHTAITLAIKTLKAKKVKRILTIPAIKDKLDPYLQSQYNALRNTIPTKKLTDLINDESFTLAPLTY